MKIIVARHAGFCMGVRMAVNTILKEANDASGPLQTLGPLIHNPQTMDLLRKKNVTTIQTPNDITAGTVFIRTHGVPPDIMAAIETKRVRIVDATCPHVKRIHRIIDDHYRHGYTIAIFGDADHAEVVGLKGFARERGHIISSLGEIEALPEREQICLVAQTTQSLKAYQAIKTHLLKRFPNAKVFDTICRATDNRQSEVENLARKADALIVVGGKNSANSTRLFEIAKRFNRRVFHIETEEELRPEDFKDVRSVAVVSGASTPSWLLNRVTDYLEEMATRPYPLPLRHALSLIRTLVSFDFFLGFSAVLLTGAVAVLQSNAPNLIHMLAAGLYIHSMYILNHLTHIAANQYEDIFKKDALVQHRRLSMFLCLLSGFASIALSYSLGSREFLLILSACSAGILYHVNLLPKNNFPFLRHRKLKDIALSKDLGIALAWSAVCVFSPDTLSTGWKAFLAPGTLFSLVFVFLLIFIRTILHDLHDIQRDRIVGRETIPIVLGKHLNFVFPHALLLTLFTLPITAYFFGWIPPKGVSLSVCAPYLYFVHFLFERNRLTHPLIFDLVVDSVILLPGILVFLLAF